MKSINLHLLTLTLTGVLLVGAAGKALAMSTDFKVFDRNGDGTINLEEFRAQGGRPQAFLEGDANQDGRLSRDEFTKADAYNDRLKAGKYVDDAWITAKAKAMLMKDEGVKGLDVNVETLKGTVQLAGWVDNPAQSTRAEAIVRSVDGVKEVKNDLQIKH